MSAWVKLNAVSGYQTVVSTAAANVPFIGTVGQSALNVDTTVTGATVSPDLFGTFLEDINSSGEGGLYNDEVRNGGFNDSSNALHAWSAAAATGVAAGLTADATTGPTTALSRSGKLTITSGVTAARRTGIANSGFFGVAVTPSINYAIEFYAKASVNFTGSHPRTASATRRSTTPSAPHFRSSRLLPRTPTPAGGRTTCSMSTTITRRSGSRATAVSTTIARAARAR